MTLQASKALPKVATALVSLILAGLFVELGIWQLHRAGDVKQAQQVKPEKAIVALDDIAQAGANLRPIAANRIVTTSGQYRKILIAPNQRPLMANGKSSKVPVALEVRLLELSNHRAILVVRGLAEDSAQIINEKVNLTGRLYPRQTANNANSGEGILARIDPALVAGLTDLSLFDGYIIAQTERTDRGQPISATRIAAPQLRTGIAGYYWQHISYVGIWWLMALIVLVLPWISRPQKVR